MRKRFAIIVVGIMTMLLAACGDATAERESEYKKKSAVTQATTPTVTPTNIPTVTPEPTVALTPAEGSRISSTYEKGTMTDTGFESEWLNLRFIAPEGVAMATQEELDVLMQQGKESIFGEKVASGIADYAYYNTVYEMQATYAIGAPSVQILVEKANYKGMTAEVYADAVVRSIERTSNTRVVCTVHDTLSKVELAGQEYVSMTVALDYGAGAVANQKYYIREKDGRMIAIVLTYVDEVENYLQEVLDGFSAYEKTVPEVFDSLALDTLRAEASATGSLCATAYLGYREGDFAEFTTFLEKSGRLEQFPFLRSLSEKNTVLASGGEWYVLVPVDENITFTVSEAVLDEITYTLVAGRELLQVGNGELLLLRGNVSDIFPSFMVTVTGAEGETINYAPGLSLKDGKLLTRDGVYDFTVYGE